MPALITGSPPLSLDEPAFRRALRRATLWPPLALAAVLATLLTLTLLRIRAADLVDHTNRAVAQAFALEILLADSHAALRSFELTGDAQFLQPYMASHPRIGAAFDALSAQVADDPAQTAATKEWRAYFTHWQDHAGEVMERVRTSGAIRDGAWEMRGQQLFDELREHGARFLDEEERLRERRVHTLVVFANAALGVLALAAVLGIPLLARTMRRVVRKVGDAYHGALAAMATQRDELHTSLRSIGDAVLATNNTGQVEFLNPVAEQLTGWSDAEARGRSFAEVMPIFHEESGESAENPVQRVLRERVVVGLANHSVLRPRHGGEIPIEDSAAPIFAADGTVRGVIVVFHDVREKHARERAQRESEWLVRVALDVGGGSAWVIDVARGVVVGDEALARTFNVPAERCRAGEPLASFMPAIHPDDREKVQSAISRSLGTGDPYHVEYRVYGADGTLRWIDSVGRLERDVSGRPARLPGVLFDVTARKEAEQALIATKERAEALAQAAAEGAERFRLLAETVSLQVWTATPDGALDWANHYVASYFGAIDLERDVLGSAWTRLVHPDDLPLAGSRWAHSITTGERYETEFRLRRGDGEYRWFLVRAEAMRGTGGVVKWFGTNTDIDALKSAQADAEAAARAKDNFLAALSHELRTPLTPVLMTAASLRADPRLPADAREQLGMMERNIALEARLIDDLLDLTRITQGKLPLRPQLCDAHSLIGLAVEIVRDDAQAKGISIERAFEARSSGLVVDPARFQQVIWNLLRNSVKFTPDRGRISIRTLNFAAATDRANGRAPRLRVEISDSGIGIDAAALERIFRPFEQAGVAGDHQFGGLGLGLAIARAIVDLHGGTIRAESDGEGHGATFIIELPDATAAPTGGLELPGAADASTDHFTNGAPSKMLRLLLVEDHAATLEVLTRLLKRAGHSVVATGSVSAALLAAARESFDAVVSDLGLPDGTGNELMTQLRDRHGLRGIALTGYGMEQDMERTREAGFIAHLVKPVDFAQLRRTLELFG